MEVGAYLVADPRPLELVEPGEGPLDDPAGSARAGAVGGAFTGDLRCDAAGPEEAAVRVVVVTAVGEQPARPVTWPSADPADAGYRVQQGLQLHDVVTVSAGQRDGQGGAVPVDDQVMPARRELACDVRADRVTGRGQFSDGMRTAMAFASRSASRDIDPPSCEAVTSRRNTS